MTCEDTSLLLDAYVDDELDLVSSIDVEKHLRNCTECARVVENHRALSSALRSGTLYFKQPPLRRLLPQEVKPRRVYAMIAVAASLLVAGFLAGRFQISERGTSQEILDSHLRSLVPGHLMDIASSDQHTVKPWFDGKLNFSPPVSDFASQGYPLIGGRVDSVDGHEAAALVYRRRQHVINLFVWPSGSRDSGLSKASQRGYNTIHWIRSGFEFWLISDVNANELENFAGQLRAEAP